MTNPSPLRIGILGAAKVAWYAAILPSWFVPEVQIASVAARDQKRAKRFAALWRIPRVHATYESLLADPEIDAIYNPLPNGLHAEWTIRALRAGKHVLCEKPFASNANEAMQMAQAAQESGKVLSEAFAYRNHPLAARMKEIVTNELGVIKKIEARFQFLLLNPSNVRWRYDLAGGALMDAGCYPLSMLRYLMGAEPKVLSAQSKLARPQVDSRTEAHLEFPSGAQAHVVCDMLSPRMFDSFLHVKGERGEMKVIGAFQPSWGHWLTLRTEKTSWRGMVRGKNMYAQQLRNFANAIRGGTLLSTNPNDAVNNMRLIDSIYEAAGLPIRGI